MKYLARNPSLPKVAACSGNACLYKYGIDSTVSPHIFDIIVQHKHYASFCSLMHQTPDAREKPFIHSLTTCLISRQGKTAIYAHLMFTASVKFLLGHILISVHIPNPNSPLGRFLLVPCSSSHHNLIMFPMLIQYFVFWPNMFTCSSPSSLS